MDISSIVCFVHLGGCLFIEPTLYTESGHIAKQLFLTNFWPSDTYSSLSADVTVLITKYKPTAWHQDMIVLINWKALQ
jgi:hypothetical protein